MFVEADNPPKEELKKLMAFYSSGELLKVKDGAEAFLKEYDQSVFLWNLLGAVFLGLTRFVDAERCFKKTIELLPDFAEGYCNYGLAIHKQGKINQAIEIYKKTLDLKPDLAEVHNNLGHLYRTQKKHVEAIEAYKQALKANPGLREAKLYKFQEQARICDWSFYEEYQALSPQLGREGAPIEPFSLISKEDNPQLQLRCARDCATRKLKRKEYVFTPSGREKPEKLKIGYFSSDLTNHPVMHLVAGMLENHNREKFEIFAFYYGPKDEHPMLEQARKSVDEFVDVTELEDAEIIDLVRAKGIDVAVDMNGYTGNSKTGLFAYRLAPIQINYLGYPSTMGAEFMDYIVGDETLIPDHLRQYYSENVIYMPDTYQPNDNTRVLSKETMCRSDYNLPQDGFVFCCFNNNYKITPQEFDIWMNLLHRVEGSVLWLLKANQWTEANILKEAQARGIAPERIIFAGRVANDVHLARQKLADLFLDTFNYNAHTTTSDALWAGLPVLTKIGQQFAARVAASLLNAAQLPELITETPSEYEELAYQLATSKQNMLKEFRQRLEESRLSVPLFDTLRYTRNIELAYEEAYHLFMSGQKPTDLRIGA
ncbi:tetratricopeptide repeat protein [Terasakiella sp. SH-1]|uniref:O-linked N-acetylglucosamine transferase, SPINDLY family protein n=1 Tax=Terasakiella sp. SH-1 TaxID=2560057 RepID=UPI0010743D38|nr:tetratricopeptide repeat protein [Terasakiella sp. SH-1]